jgi:raffinose/stachyose/melibiose transport system permease protein
MANLLKLKFNNKSSNEPEPSPHLAIMNKKTLAIIYAVLVFFSLIVLIPLLWLLFTSLKSQQDLANNTWGLPQRYMFSNYFDAWVKSRIGRYLLNSVYSTAVAVVVTLVTVCPISFVLARFNFKGNRLVYYFAIAGMMIPIHSAIIPIYIMVGDLDAYNSLPMLGLIYGAFRIPVSVFIMESFIRILPKELDECASIDGCSTWKLFYKVTMPLSKDGIVTICVLAVLGCWNELLVSMLIMNETTKKTLPSGLMSFFTEYTSDYTKLAAGVMIAIVPAVIFYAFASNKIEKGMIAGAIKG